MLQTFLPRDLDMVRLCRRVFSADRKPAAHSDGRLLKGVRAYSGSRDTRRSGTSGRPGSRATMRRAQRHFLERQHRADGNRGHEGAEPHRVGDRQRERLVDALHDDPDVGLDECPELFRNTGQDARAHVAHGRDVVQS